MFDLKIKVGHDDFVFFALYFENYVIFERYSLR